MHIDTGTFEPGHPDRPLTASRNGPLPLPVSTDDRESSGVRPGSAGPVRFDSAQIPASGHAFADCVDARARDDAEPRFGADRVAELQSRIAAGAYDSIDAVDALARRILMRGDL